MKNVHYKKADDWKHREKHTTDFHQNNVATYNEQKERHEGNVHKIVAQKETHEKNVHIIKMQNTAPCRSRDRSGTCIPLGL